MTRLIDRSTVSIDAGDLHRWLIRALDRLRQRVPEIDALNVFPVPDGDTGSNMYHTLRSALDTAASHSVAGHSDAGDPTIGVGDYADALAHGALLGARGNSGVILSQYLAGWSRAWAGLANLEAQNLVDGFKAGDESARTAVSNPVEGTILSVTQAAAQAVVDSLADGSDIADMLAAAAVAAEREVQASPTRLPVLAEAGVVDAGGRGLEVLLQAIAGEARRPGSANVGPGLERPTVAGAIADHSPGAGGGGEAHGGHPGYMSAAVREAHDLRSGQDGADDYGYCTEFLVLADEVDQPALREAVAELGDSVIVGGTKDCVRVHVHTQRPDAALTAALMFGDLDKVKIENMNRQHEATRRIIEVSAAAPASPVQPRVALDAECGLAAVAAGSGARTLFEELGAVVVVGGPTMNPSVQELASAVEALAAPCALLLPNDANVVATARQAAEIMAEKRPEMQVRVVETKSMPEGMAAALAFHPLESFEENERRMTAAALGVVTLAVARATRDTKLGEREIQQGEFIALVSDQLVAAAPTLINAAADALDAIVDPTIATVMVGSGADARDVDLLEAEIAGRWPSVTVERVETGQPHYPFLIGFEFD